MLYVSFNTRLTTRCKSESRTKYVEMVRFSGLMIRPNIAAIFICFLMICNAQIQKPTRPVVVLKSGSVLGVTYPIPFGYIADRFIGIPYAAPPVGNLRFAAPQPVVPWEGVKDVGLQFAAKCPQNTVPFPWNVTVGKSSETVGLCM